MARLFLALVAIAGMALALEVASRKLLESRFGLEAEFPVGEIRKPMPYVMFGGDPESERLNRLGYPGPAPPQSTAAEEDAVWIFVLGGSTVFNGDPPIPTLLEREFHAHGSPRVRIFNFGVVSSVSGMELSRLLRQVVDYEPDWVVAYGGGNDILHPWTYDPRPGHPFNFVVYESNPILESDIHSYPHFVLALYGSHLARVLFPRYFSQSFLPLERLREEAGWDTDKWRRQIAETYFENIRKSAEISRVFGAGYTAVLQPLVYFKAATTDQERKAWNTREARHALAVRDEIRLCWSAASPMLQNHWLDSSDLFADDTTDVFTDAIHIEQDDRQRVAEVLYRVLREPLAKRLAKRDDEAEEE